MSAVLTPPGVSPVATAGQPQVPPPIVRKTLADLLRELGDVSTDRVRLFPYPGTATEADLLAANRVGRFNELVNGTLVEKPMGNPEASLAMLVGHYLLGFVLPRGLGFVTAPDGMYRMLDGNVREPDVSFTRRERVQLPLAQVGGWCPDLCVEVLSPSNTRAEMAAKRAEYFAAGCRLVWEIDPKTRTATIYTSPDAATAVDQTGALDGGDGLPGFTLPLHDLFGSLDSMTAPPPSP